MPELPEVEVTRRTIAPGIEGARILGVHIGKPLRWPLGCEAGYLVGRSVGRVARRGKYLWLPLSARNGHDRHQDVGGLLLHLGMSGSLNFAGATAPPGPHDHFELRTDAGVLRLHDPRRFGSVVWSRSLQDEPARSRLSRLGLEPFDAELTAEYLHAALQQRRQAIKPLLLAGDIVVGAGNIYACEALFRAGIDPRLPANRLTRPRATRLLAALQDTLRQALALGGSTLRDFRDAHGRDGAFQQSAAVYGREGQPCPVCARPVRRLTQGQRSTYCCTHCQRR